MEVMSYAQYRHWQSLPLSERRKLAKAAHEKNRAPRDRSERDQSERYARERLQRLENVAIFDTETDPFDNTQPDEKVLPFLGVLYAPSFEPVVIWEQDFDTFIEKCCEAFEALEGRWTIYAHNGGRFDWRYFYPKMHGRLILKGTSIMSARIGRHEVRDSYNLIPTKLAAFQKDEFDYEKMRRSERDKYREQIIEYCINDCRYLYRTVKAFLEMNGFVLTIGQAAMKQIKKVYKFDRLNERLDTDFRRFYHGGRVECLQGAGRWNGEYKLYDINSAYPYAMAYYNHPHKTADISWRYNETPNADTFFVRLRCKNNGALITPPTASLSNNLVVRNNANYAGCEISEGEFCTTIWEHDVALKHGLITDVEYLECIDFAESTNFADFILPNYEKREPCKALIADYEARMSKQECYAHEEYQIAVRDSMFYKLLNNNGYGKFAQNPRNFRETFILPYGEFPEGYNDANDDTLWMTEEDGDPPLFTLFSRPCPEPRYNNVAIAASITGKVRSILMDAIHNAIDAIYCDTDCLLCKELNNVKFSQSELGAWNYEGTFDDIIIAGKKLYAARNTVTGKKKFASKGVSSLKWHEYEAMISGKSVISTAFGVTISRNGEQDYLRRTVKQTAPSRVQLKRTI